MDNNIHSGRALLNVLIKNITLLSKENKMLKKAAFYAKLGSRLIKKDVVNKEDFRKEYNKVSATYSSWLDEMGQFTVRIINLEHVSEKKRLKVLDFACGTGYISKKLLEKDIDCQITAVDYSDKMLEKLKDINDSRIRIVHYNGIEYLKGTNEKFDLIFIGWGLPYFNYKEVFKLFKEVLNPGGVVKIITNVQGTLSGIENIFMKVMYKNQKEIIKPMDIRFNLPKGKKGLIRWFNQYGFEELEVEDGERTFVFDKAEQVLKWLEETGAIAGTASIFKDYDLIKNDLIDEIGKSLYNNGMYEINHRFVYGTFKLI